jgi:protein phosphatase 1 regulatory subunit 21
VLQNRLELCLQNKLQAETSLQKMQDYAAKLQEDLQTTTQNYETQLSIMSEHLANMNDKLTVQRDEIDQLKYQMTNKVSLYTLHQLSTGMEYHGISRMRVSCCLRIRVCFPYNLKHHA